MRSFSPLALFTLFALVGCASEVDNKPQAQVKDAPMAAPVAPPPPAPVAPAATGAAWAFDGTGSKIEFVAAKVTRDHTGGFADFKGQAQVAGGQVTSVEVEIQLTSVTTDTEKLTNHLKSPDFFDVAGRPTASFKSTKIEATTQEGATHLVTGTFDFNGAQKELSFPAKIEVTDGKAHVTAEFTIDRQLWGLAYPGKPDDLIKDQVLIKLDVNLAPAAA